MPFHAKRETLQTIDRAATVVGAADAALVVGV